MQGVFLGLHGGGGVGGGVLSCSPNPDRRPYFRSIPTVCETNRENSPRNFRCFTYGDKHYKLLTIKHIK